MRTLAVATLKIPASRPLKPYEAAVIRGYLGRLFPDNPLFHHHLDNGFLYTYPRIQFKVIDGIAYIVIIEEGIALLTTIQNTIINLKLVSNRLEFYEPGLQMTTVSFGSTDEEYRYVFITPWLALNERNFQIYVNSDKRDEILKRALIGNILSMSKGLGYVVENDLRATLSMKEIRATLKGTPMLGFLGEFVVNFEIPDYWGLGKSVSRGFGTIKKSLRVGSL
ncbi:hypothetical protein HPY86_08610 [candidate division WOR-3 bacterium]|nr:hypothetical protein [candidate division WOR-3 bacterium]